MKKRMATPADTPAEPSPWDSKSFLLDLSRFGVLDIRRKSDADVRLDAATLLDEVYIQEQDQLLRKSPFESELLHRLRAAAASISRPTKARWTHLVEHSLLASPRTPPHQPKAQAACPYWPKSRSTEYHRSLSMHSPTRVSRENK